VRTDYVQRFLFEELDIRGRLVCLTGAWEKMLEGRSYPPQIAALLGQTTALATLLGANRKGAGRTTLQVRGNGPVPLLVADCGSDPTSADLKIRGMAHHQPDASGTVRELIGEGRFALMLEDTKSGQIYQSVVPLEGETLSEIFEHYLTQSEQLLSFVRLFADGQALCGLLLEKLPKADERDPDGWNRMTQFAATLTLAETRDVQPYDLLTRLFPEELLRVYKLDPVEYHCPYDVEKVKDMLRSLGRAEVESILVEKGEVLIKNEMCNHEYRFDAGAVAEIFTERINERHGENHHP
jgi:molecular chaperone Hsp33